jgi:hypothetical protein
MAPIEFPFILAGPIVRRVEPTQIYIWIATSSKCRIDAKVWKITPSTSNEDQYEKLKTKTSTTSIHFGKQLFHHLIKISPTDYQFPTETLLGYNLFFNDGSKKYDLDSFHLLTSNHPQGIVYGNLKYPAFHIQGENSNPSILYGSCRKPHGTGDDTLAFADILLEETYFNPKNRPQALFLLGDQIYADDVAHPLIPVVIRFAYELMGNREPLECIEPRLRTKRFLKAREQINARQYLMENVCQFTSAHAQNHLIELGEYAAMYLMAWSPALWELAQANGLIRSFEEADSEKLIYYMFADNNQSNRELETERLKLREQYNDQQESLISFQQSLYQVRRLLANIPTYMIFDDHDITDDWNLSYNWKNNVKSSPLGRHVISNGLLAYWAFQGWGNDPDAFSDHFLKKMKSYLSTVKACDFSTDYEQAVEQLWNFDSWHFAAPTQPRSIFLDTRTQREYDSLVKKVKFGNMIEEANSSPELLNKKAWDSVTQKLFSSGWSQHTPLIVVSATPVYGMGLIESFLHDYVYPIRLLGVEVQTTVDFEAWKYNGKGFTKFLHTAASWNPSICIILSGDVHYASEVKADIHFASGVRLAVHQCTSSPLKNMSLTGVWGMLMKLVIGANSFERKNKELHRICTPNYEILRIDQDDPGPIIWEDFLTYQNLNGKSNIETNNNLGKITLINGRVENSLLNKRPTD